MGKELLLLPIRLTQAALRGLGRMIVQKWEESAFLGNPYVNMTPEQRHEIELNDGPGISGPLDERH